MGKMFIFMDKPRATGWFEFGTILESRPASGLDFALPRPHTLNPCSPSSPPPPPPLSTGRCSPYLHFLGVLQSLLSHSSQSFPPLRNWNITGRPGARTSAPGWIVGGKVLIYSPLVLEAGVFIITSCLSHVCFLRTIDSVAASSAHRFDCARTLPTAVASCCATLLTGHLCDLHVSAGTPTRARSCMHACMHACAGHRGSIGVFVCLKVLRQMFSLPDEISARVCGSGFVKAWSISAVWVCCVHLAEDHFYTDLRLFESNSRNDKERIFDLFVFFYSHPSIPTNWERPPQGLGHLSDIMIEMRLIAVLSPAGTVV